MGVDDTIQVRCSRCKTKFRDKARRVREGYSRQCPSCERVLFFIEGSPNKDISDALKEAEYVRKLLRQEEDEKAAEKAAAAAATAARAEADPSGEEATPQYTGRARVSGRTIIRSR